MCFTRISGLTPSRTRSKKSQSLLLSPYSPRKKEEKIKDKEYTFPPLHFFTVREMRGGCCCCSGMGTYFFWDDSATPPADPTQAPTKKPSFFHFFFFSVGGGDWLAVTLEESFGKKNLPPNLSSSKSVSCSKSGSLPVCPEKKSYSHTWTSRKKQGISLHFCTISQAKKRFFLCYSHLCKSIQHLSPFPRQKKRADVSISPF